MFTVPTPTVVAWAGAPRAKSVPVIGAAWSRLRLCLQPCFLADRNVSGWFVTGLMWALLCLLTNFVLYARGQTPLAGDALSSNLPLKYLAIEQMSQGRVPLWTSKLGCGSPLLADTISLPFDPRNLWWLALSPIAAYWAMLVTSRLICGWICLAYFRVRHGLAFGPAFVATVVYFLGTVLAEERHLHSTGVILEAFPGILWLTERLLEKADFWRTLALTVAWAALFFIGSIAYLVYLPVLSLFWALGLACFLPPRKSIVGLARISLVYAVSLCWAAALCAVTFLPLVELVGLSNRGGEYPQDPFAFRSLFHALFGAHESTGWFLDFNHFFYVGVISLPIILGCWQEKTNAHVRTAKWLAVLALLGLVITTSPLKPVLVHWVPILATVAFFRLSFFWGMLAAVLVGHGLQESARVSGRVCVISGRLLTCLHAAPLMCMPLFVLWLIMLRFEWPAVYHVLRDLLKPYLGMSFIVLVAIRVLGLGVVARPLFAGSFRQAVVGMLIVGELLLTWILLRHGVQRVLHYPLTREVAYLQHTCTPDDRIAEVLLPPNVPADPHLKIYGYMSLYADTAAVHGLATANLYQSLLSRDFSRFMDHYGDLKVRKERFKRATNAVMITSAHDSPLLDAQAIRFFVARTPLPASLDLRLRVRGEAFLVYERIKALPRAFFVPRARYGTATEVSAWLEEAGASSYDDDDIPIDFRKEVLLEADPCQVPGRANAADGKAVPARIIADRDSEMEVAASCPTCGFLVLSDTYFPGWEAWIDGAKVPIFRANGYARAIAISAGEHLVTFRYEPASFIWGLRVTLFSAGCSVLGCACVWLCQRRSAARPQEVVYQAPRNQAA